MKIAILGFGQEGRAAYKYWHDTENEITICDQNKTVELPNDAKSKLGDGYLSELDDFDLIVRSPGIHLQDLVTANSPAILSKVTTNSNEFFRVCPTKNIIGVTGTKGKGTTATLISKMLELAGKRVHLGGNIGVPPLAMLKEGIQPEDWVVLELASFQLIDLQYSPHLAICLMVVPEHLNWHANINEYISAKQALFSHQAQEDMAIYNAASEASKQIASVSPGKQIPYLSPPGAYVEEDAIVIDGQVICKTGELKLLGKHNWQNVCAAITAAWQVTQDVEALGSVLTTFSSLEHRLEFVREVNGVKYYDDSFGTTPETAMVAIEAFQEPKVVVLGGSDKGSDYDELAKTVAQTQVRKVILIGRMAPKIREALAKAGFNDVQDGGTTMQEIVEAARAAAKPGDVVLLSTACASFDMFKNYKDRGEQFKKAVQALV